jgi:chromosome partitioning protein
MSVVSVINYKGGVGKTTLTANLGAELANRGRKILLIDLDPQSSLTFSFSRIDQWERELATDRTVLTWLSGFVRSRTIEPLYKYVVTPRAVNQIVHAGGSDGRLDLIASHLGLIDLDLDLAAAVGGARFQASHPEFVTVHRLFAEALDDPAFQQYDMVLIDCAPNFNMVTRAAIVASDHVLIPARPDYLSTLGIDYLRGRLSGLVTSYNGIAKLDINPEIVGVVYTMVQMATNGPINAQRVSMQRLTGIEIPIFRQYVRDNKTAITDAGDTSVPAVLAAGRTPALVNLQYELQQFASEFVARTRI